MRLLQEPAFSAAAKNLRDAYRHFRRNAAFAIDELGQLGACHAEGSCRIRDTQAQRLNAMVQHEPPGCGGFFIDITKARSSDSPMARAPYARNRTTFWVCSPSPAMLSFTTSPTFRNFGSGFMPSATPGGVPVIMTSPGSRTMNCEQYHTRCATPKIIVLVEPFWRGSPFTVSHMSRFCGSGISSLVTSHGPSGPNVSEPLPLVHWPARSIWNTRSETSLARQ